MFRLILLAATTAIVAATPAAARKPSQLIVFGDSLVDSGNINAAVGSDFFNPVARGYFPGRFTNGPNYNDLLNQRFFGSFMTPSLLGGTNYAYGGARYVDHGDPVPDLASQFGQYFTASGNTVDPDALYILNFGAMTCSGSNRGKSARFRAPQRIPRRCSIPSPAASRR